MIASVIVLNHNTLNFTVNCIQSVIDNTSAFQYEIIVVDNASTNDNLDEFENKFPCVKLIRSDKNLGFSRGNNLGIAHSKGDYILLLNSDTILLNDAISFSLNFLEKHINVGVVTCTLEYPDGTVQHNCQRFPSIKYKIFELLMLQKILGRSIGGRILLGSFFDYDTVVYPDWVWGTFFIFRKELLQELPEKKLADEFFMYCEDMQWCLEFRRLGYNVAFIPQARVTHFMGMSKAPKTEMMKMNHKIFMSKYYSFIHRKVISLLDRALKIINYKPNN